jgi:hypothetical protein
MRLCAGQLADWQLPRANRARQYELAVFQRVIQRSSVVERSAVNRLVVGSNPTAGASSLHLNKHSCAVHFQFDFVASRSIITPRGGAAW